MGKRTDIAALLKLLRIDAKKEEHKWVALCPNPDHDDKHPSWSIADVPGEYEHGSHNCFSCGYGGGPWELAATIWDMPLEEAGKKLGEYFSGDDVERPVEETKVVFRDNTPPEFPWPIGCKFPSDVSKWFRPAYRYLQGRGITDEQIVRHHLGYALSGRLAYRIIVPVFTGGKVVTYAARAFIDNKNPRYLTPPKVRGVEPNTGIFGADLWDKSVDVVTIAEGSFSMLALERAGFPNPCAVLGSNISAEKLLLLSQFGTMVVATDPDQAGDKAFRRLAVMSRRATVIRLDLECSPDDMNIQALVEKKRGLFSGLAPS